MKYIQSETQTDGWSDRQSERQTYSIVISDGQTDPDRGIIKLAKRSGENRTEGLE